MSAGAHRFPGLRADAPLADVQIRQTMALGLLPLGMALLLMASVVPDGPSPWLLAGTVAVLGAIGGMRALWHRSRTRPVRGYATAHFLVRYFFLAVCPFLLWGVAGEALVEKLGWFPPLSLGLWLWVYPVERILREYGAPDPLQSPRIDMARMACRHLLNLLLLLTLAVTLSVVVVDAQKDYPTDPTPLLLFIWIVVFAVMLSGLVLVVGHWNRLFQKEHTPQPLDDPPEPRSSRTAIRFGSENF